MERIAACVMLLGASLYVRGIVVLWTRAGVGHGLTRWQVAAFAGAVITIAAALFSPLASHAEIRLPVHMIQHELLMMIAAPLTVAAQPGLAMLWGLPETLRSDLADWLNRRWMVRAWTFVTAPFVAFTIHALALWFWHVPALFEGAVSHDAVHALQHGSFLGSACLLWWSLAHRRYSTAGYGVAAFYLFLTSLHSGALGTLLTIASRPWYPSYAAATQNPAMALEDQQLAGLLMWIPFGLPYVIGGLAFLGFCVADAKTRVRFATCDTLGDATRERLAKHTQQFDPEST
jgi:putative membrane protein